MFQHLELVVDCNAERLKYAREGLVQVNRKNSRLDDAAQLRRSFDAPACSRPLDRPRDSPAVTFFAPGEEDIRKLFFGRCRYDVGCGHSGLLVHSHVEGSVRPKAEPPPGFVYLMRRHSEIEEYAVDGRDAEFRKFLL